ncbi:MAG: hypothetical protein HKL90_01135 [Elusimicrobia bacterium]|nr:hypothetical protein [Elusimicrobiota bacterium]
MNSFIIAFLFLSHPVQAARVDIDVVASVQDPLGGMSFSTSTCVELLLTDSFGRKTGYSNGRILDENPDAGHAIESIGDDETDAPGPTSATIGVSLSSATSYGFNLTLLGLTDSEFILTIHRTDMNSRLLPAKTFTGLLPRGASRQFQIVYNPSPGGTDSIIAAVTFDTIREELHSAASLGRIGDKKFVGELDDILAQGETTLTRNDWNHDSARANDASLGRHRALANLRGFVASVENAAKSKTGRAHDRDQDNRRFASATASQSLLADAKTLIQQLGGKPQSDGDDHNQIKGGQ